MLDPSFAARLDATLAGADAEHARHYPGPTGRRQPVHTVYVPADRFGAHTVGEWRAGAIAALDQHGPLPDLDPALEIAVRDKLALEPVEDLRIDFEDGYGLRPGDEEDAHAREAGNALGRMLQAGSAPAFVGVRMKSLEAASRRRGLRTLELFLENLLGFAALPRGFRITLPKVTSVRQIEAMVEICAALESAYTLPGLRFEIQIETPQAILGADGTALVAPMLHAALGRCVGLHYGTYDYSAALGIAATQQSMEHPSADHAKAVMQVAAAGTGVPVCDGSTNVLPVGSRDAVRAAWSLHARLVRRSLERGFYQGWDLHPAQLPTRFAATFAFYLRDFAVSADRLRAYRTRGESGVLDEPATARALAGFLLRGLACGAFSEELLQEQAGLSSAELSELATPSG
jgi:citrate lyase beta subunit